MYVCIYLYSILFMYLPLSEGWLSKLVIFLFVAHIFLSFRSSLSLATI